MVSDGFLESLDIEEAFEVQKSNGASGLMANFQAKKSSNCWFRNLFLKEECGLERFTTESQAQFIIS